MNLYYYIHIRDVTTGKYLLRPLRWWAESAPLVWDRVKVSENLGATAVTPVAPVVTSLRINRLCQRSLILKAVSDSKKR